MMAEIDPAIVDRDETYKLAVEVAKVEHDELMPEFKKMERRLAALRMIITGGLHLTNQPTEDWYMYPRPIPQPGGSESGGQNRAQRRR